MNPYVFFVGCPRSGTTLIQRLGNAHPLLAVTHETLWIARWWEKRKGLTDDGMVTPKLLARLSEHRRFRAFKMDPEALNEFYRAGQELPYAEFVTRLFDRFGEERGKRLVGDKTPSYVLHIPTLGGLWPRAKFVHAIRDGRDVCLSMLEWEKGARRFPTWDEDRLTTIAIWWDWHVRLGREAAPALGEERYYELRYERLVADSEGECQRLCTFLEIPYDDAMLNFYEGRFRDDPGLDAKNAWRPVTSGLRTWQTQMSPDEVVRFEAAAGDLLEELGYPRKVAAIPRPALEHASRIREQFAREVESRSRSLPSAWVAVAA